MKYLYFILAFISGPICLLAQKHIANTLVLKIRPEYAAQARAAGLPQSLFAPNTLSVCKQMFADAGPVAKPKSAVAQADLRTIYECVLKPSANANTDKIIFQLQKHPYIEYIEAMREFEPLYTPNDPHANPSIGGQAPVLRRIRAYQAWDISKGDSLTTIGILDTGLRWFFEDFAPNLRTNPADPINGIDDDQNGLIDDFRGWDFADNDNNPDITNNGHGGAVAGLACATPDNNKGLAGTGFYTKVMPVRIFGNRFAGYQGIVYAAQKGCKVINLSWGGPGSPSTFEQDVIRYAAINQDVLIVAAGGNTNAELLFYPASYDFVVAVAHTDTSDRKNINATFNTKIDVCAPGTAMFGTDGINYGPIGDGSSYAAPLVSGAAALVRARFPTLNALQAAEMLRINADDIGAVPFNAPFAGKLGRGRLNMEKSLQPLYQHAARLSEFGFDAGRGLSTPLASDTVRTTFRITNFLQPIANAQITLMPNPEITVLQAEYASGSMASQASLLSTPAIVFVCNNNLTSRRILLTFKIEYASVTDFHYEYVNLNTNTITLKTPTAALTLASNGRIGFEADKPQTWGGLVFQNKNQIYSGGLIVASSAVRVADCVVGTTAVANNHFKPLLPLRFLPPVGGSSAGARQYGFGIFSDSLAGPAAPGIRTRLRAHGYQNGLAANSFVLEYEVENTTNQALDSVSVGIFADWDLENSNRNFAAYDSVSGIGYCYGYGVDTVFVGIAAINPAKNYRAFCVLDTFGQNLPGNIKLSDGLSQAEKFSALNMGLSRSSSHPNAVFGTAIAVIAGQKVYNLAAGRRKKVAYSIVMGKSLAQLRAAYTASIESATTHIAGPMPTLPSILVCRNQPALLLPEGAAKYNFYQSSNLSASSLVRTGPAHMIVSVDTAGSRIWVTNLDSLLESRASAFVIRAKKPLVSLSSNITNPIFPTDSVVIYSAITQAAAQIRWQVSGLHTSSPKTTNPIRVKFAGPGSYTVKIWVKDSSGCADSLAINISVPLSNKAALDTKGQVFFELFPNPSQSNHQTYLKATKSGTIHCYNAIGQMVFSYQIAQTITPVALPAELQKLASGSYMFRFEDSKGSGQMIKWLKK